MNNLFEKITSKRYFELANDKMRLFAYRFGLVFNSDYTYKTLLSSRQTFESDNELELELNAFANYVFGEHRRVIFHTFRQFPYIEHGQPNKYDASGIATNYLQSDFYFIRFVKLFLSRNRGGEYLFFSTRDIIRNTTKIGYCDCTVAEMPIDVIIY